MPAREDRPAEGRRSFVVLEGCFYQGDVWLDGDPTRLSQVLGNVVHDGALAAGASYNGSLNLNWEDEVVAKTCLTHDGAIKNEAARKAVEGA